MGPCWSVTRHAAVFASISLTSFLLWTRECPTVLWSLQYGGHGCYSNLYMLWYSSFTLYVSLFPVFLQLD